jgi:GT2 family glycosyltransferase
VEKLCRRPVSSHSPYQDTHLNTLSSPSLADFAVAIISFNTVELLRACLNSVVMQSPAEVIVIDNASSDGSAEMVRTEYPTAILKTNQTNLGYGAAANLAIASSTAKYVLLLNADTVLGTGALVRLRSYLDVHSEAAVVGPRLLNPDGSLQSSCRSFPRPISLYPLIKTVPIWRNHYLLTWKHDQDRVVDWLWGAALAIRREAFNSARGFDESFFMYFEEVDLCWRLRQNGWQIHFTPSAEVTHIGRASSRQCRAEMEVALYASTKRFYRKHCSRPMLLLALVTFKCKRRGRLIRDSIRLSVTKDPERRTRIVQDIASWRRVLRELERG